MNKIDKLTNEELKVLDKLHGNPVLTCHAYCTEQKLHAGSNNYFHEVIDIIQQATQPPFFNNERVKICKSFHLYIQECKFTDRLLYQLTEELEEIDQNWNQAWLNLCAAKDARDLANDETLSFPIEALKEKCTLLNRKKFDWHDSLPKRIEEYLEKEQKNDLETKGD
jgi:hypothetical protein